MESNIFTRLEILHKNSFEIFQKLTKLPDRDIKRKHIEAISSQIATSLITLKICNKYTESNKAEFEKLFNNNYTLIDNYIHTFKQSIVEAILDTALFQTELVLRVLYSKLTCQNPTKERNINKIIAELFEDIQNNWQKDETKVLVLFWTIRNTIHTGGIYYRNNEGYKLTYKDYNYHFEYGKSLQFLEDIHILDLFTDFLSSLDYLFNSEKVIELGYIEHPSYYALSNATK
jgi:hypothetical protein